MLDTEPEIVNKPDAHVLTEIRGNVTFDDVTFGYEPGQTVVSDVSLEAKSGQVVAIVGPTGAGKTTLVNLLSRFYDVRSGRIMVDGFDVRDIEVNSLRTRMGVVLQEPYFFADTIMTNIKYGKPTASDEEAIEAARTADADHFIRRLPEGYQTMLLERGANLSEGERQLLAIARAILADPRILVLDEATSSVDSLTEAKIQAGPDQAHEGPHELHHRSPAFDDPERGPGGGAARPYDRGARDARRADGSRRVLREAVPASVRASRDHGRHVDITDPRRNRMIEIEATVPLAEVPEWAVMERALIRLMEESVEPFLAKYTNADGRLIWREGLHGTRDGADDFYESFYNWPLLYLLGGDDRLLELGKRQWDATTRLLEEMGHIHKEYEIGYDQFHQSESYIYFYLLCMADPSDSVNRERATRFAGFYLNEDPDAANYDTERRIIRCVHNGSGGPRWLYEEDDEPSYRYAPGMAIYGLPFEDIDGIVRFEDLKDAENARRMGRAMKVRMGKGDAAANLSVCSLVANAYLLTGDRKYRDWLEEYVGAWVERAAANGGLVPDNVGLSGEVGEYLGGRWYGSMYGWTWPHGFYNVGYAALVAGISAYLVTGEERWLDFPRSQLREIMKLGKTIDLHNASMSLEHHWTGQLRALGSTAESWAVPYRHGDSGWTDYQPMTPIPSVALWNASGSDEDRAFLEELRRKEAYDWRIVTSFRTKEDSGHEQPWWCFLNGENPDYPERDPSGRVRSRVPASRAHPPRRDGPAEQSHSLVAAA
jgi:energy-coupling factor transporter ATP-binding protein EcfA2